jgi:RNA 3'-terminal phosphate cyclase (ATP)
MITIDGSEGEGGGQIVRNALALSLVTGEPFRITNIRGRRERPGLMRQHVTAIEAACTIGNARCDGLGVGSPEISFYPGTVVAGDYHFAVGTAGSTGLVLQTILVPLLLADKPSRLTLEGGTHNMLAPPFEFIAGTFLPILSRMGPRVEARLIRHGFYPRGGGRVEIDITPSPLQPIECMERGVLQTLKARAFVAGLPYEIAQREIQKVREILELPGDACSAHVLDEERGPGNILLVEAAYENVTEIVSGFGQLGVSAEALAKTAAHRMAGYLGSKAFAGPYLADQLILPFMIVGRGCFTTVKPSEHTRTAIRVGESFLGRRGRVEDEKGGGHLVSIA